MNANGNCPKRKEAISNELVQRKNLELDFRLFLSDIHYHYVLNLCGNNKNSIEANVRYRILCVISGNSRMSKSNIRKVDMKQNGGAIGNVLDYKSKQGANWHFFARGFR